MVNLFDFLIKSRFLVFGFWFLLTISLSYFAIKFESETSLDFVPPHNSVSYNSKRIVD
jgi:hypothetical protein